MNGERYISVILTIALSLGALACGPGGATDGGDDELADSETEAGDGDGDGDGSTEVGETGTADGCGDGDGDGDGDGEPALAGACYACDDDNYWPSDAADCAGPGLVWCGLDGAGYPADCVEECYGGPPPLAGCCVCDTSGSWCEALRSEADCDALGMAWGAPTEWYPSGCEAIGDDIVCEGSCEMDPVLDGWCCDCATVNGPLPICEPLGAAGCGDGWCEIGPGGNPGDCAEACG